MSSAPLSTNSPPPDHGPVPIPALAALLSFAVPGLGQIVQGWLAGNKTRFAKGFLFLVVVWGMFFFGFLQAKMQNVYLPHIQEYYLSEDQRMGRVTKSGGPLGKPLPPFLGNLWNRPQYVMQFWAGLPAWPALWNYLMPDSELFSNYQVSPGTVKNGKDDVFLRKEHFEACETKHNEIQKDPSMGRLWDCYWIYTVIAGALNIMVIYDAWAGPVKFRVAKKKEAKKK
jgi:hypothetical protein